MKDDQSNTSRMTADEINQAIQRGMADAERRAKAYREYLAYVEQGQARRRMPKKKAFKGIATP